MTLLRITAITLLTGCNLADPSLLDRFRDAGNNAPLDGSTSGEDASTPLDGSTPGEDASTPDGVDAGPPPSLAVDNCGETEGLFVIAETRTNLEIDTRWLSPSTTVPCAGSIGHDGFLAVDVAAGEYWHFHLRVDPSDPDALAHDPVLYLLAETSGSCDTRSCVQSSQSCETVAGDEHFAFLPSSTGRWFIGIDDSTAGGGRYLLDAIRPVCGNGEAEHGESCDGQDGCSEDCRWILDEENVNERIPNDNFSEANAMQLPASGELEIRGDLGGQDGCFYPDLYAITVPEGGARLQVDVRDGSGSVCTAGPALPVRATLFNALGTVRGGDARDNGCPFIDEMLPAATYFVQIDDDRVDVDRVLRYRLLFRMAP